MAGVPVPTSSRRMLLASLAWTAVAAVSTVVIEHDNGAATDNLRRPEDVLFLAFLLAPAAAGALTLRAGRARTAGWLLLASSTLAATGLLLHAAAVSAARNGSEPIWLVWPALWSVGPAIALLALVPFRVRNPNARPRLEPLALLVITAVVLALAFGPQALTGVGATLDPIENPASVRILDRVAPAVLSGATAALLLYGVLGLAALGFDAIRKREGRDGALLPWAVLGLVLIPLVLIGAVVGDWKGFGSFEGAWLVAVILPLVVLAGTAAGITLGWTRDRRTAQALRRVADVRELERVRVRRDLHDGIGPALAGMRLQLDVLRDTLPPQAPEAHAAADRLEQSLEETLEELRRIVDGMQPGILETQGLRGALDGLAAALISPVDGRTTAVELEIADDLPTLSPDVEAVLLRVCAEALSNAVRHARPAHCKVEVAWSDGSAHLTILDDGAGIAQAATADGLGLRSMRGRVEAIGGTLEVLRRTDGPGTAVTAVVPGRG